mmetsp:Transcript_82487/g.256182  ORF Transcript_82487/g.256182 Transcript_82487/m.256182 type:complete len:190 (-) Transcript_82487:99-668(-)
MSVPSSSGAAPPGGANASSAAQSTKLLHKVWGRIELFDGSSEDAEARMEALRGKLDTIALVDSSSTLHPSQSDIVKQHSESAPRGDVVFVPASVGSEQHLAGNCKACHFFKGGDSCRYGYSCIFCHHHVEERVGRPGKKKRTRLENQRAKLLEQGMDAFDGKGAPRSAELQHGEAVRDSKATCSHKVSL